MTTLHISGFPHIGRKREFKHALDAYWSGTLSQQKLVQTAHAVREENWGIQIASGLDWLTVGDFSYYDQMLDLTCMLGAIPKRFDISPEKADLDAYFILARGAKNTPALALTKWFDTNYHYLVPEVSSKTTFSAYPTLLTEAIQAAKLHQLPVKATLIGPLTWLYLS
ncbi:MAG: 5-methyltetrahydropteroyltriglutamate--homocysteine S-methyltransferase, partial [Pseudomonadota bacterium]|nr:5-methyltetrahydropteroyltriglutamate--homocysteine S-methyltransferase [Pseudomonadota bacterium]